MWGSIANLGGLRTLNDPQVHVVDLAATDFTTARSTPVAEDDLAPFNAVSI